MLYFNKLQHFLVTPSEIAFYFNRRNNSVACHSVPLDANSSQIPNILDSGEIFLKISSSCQNYGQNIILTAGKLEEM